MRSSHHFEASPQASLRRLPRSSSKARRGWGRRRSGTRAFRSRSRAASRAPGAPAAERDVAQLLRTRRPPRSRARRSTCSAARWTEERALPRARPGGRRRCVPGCARGRRGCLERVPGACRRPVPSSSRSTTSSGSILPRRRPWRTRRDGWRTSRSASCSPSARESRAPLSRSYDGRFRPIASSRSRSARSTWALCIASCWTSSESRYRGPCSTEVHQASGGNPFYALELVRMLQRSGISVEAGHRLPVPDSLHELVHGRVLALPPASRDYLLAAAALSHPTTTLVEAATGVSRSDGLLPAREARVVELDGDRIRFTHPLLASGAYETADPLRRAEMHARLAELVEDPEARGRHLAASVDEPDEGVAAALDEAAQHARARGSLRAAALLLDRARELTPDDRPEDALRRAVEAANLHFESGDSPRAELQLEDVIRRLPAGRRAGERAGAARTCALVRGSGRRRRPLPAGRERGGRRSKDPGRGARRRGRVSLPASGAAG